MPSDAPPSSAEVTTSLTCLDSVDVNAFTNSGITAPARVPQEMIEASFHHCVPSPREGIIAAEMAKVQTREVSGDSKFILSMLP